MKQFKRYTARRVMLFMAALMIVAIALTLQASPAQLQGATPYPTDYPSEKQTQEAVMRQTQETAKLTPIPTGTYWYFPPITNTPFLMPTQASTLAGMGVIYDDGDDSIGKLLNVRYMTVWYAIIGGKRIQVFAGSAYNDNTQGAVYVDISIPGKDRLPDGGLYLTPDHSGAVKIVGAQGERLILQSAQGQTYYFDVPGERFTTSLADVVPTVTLWPITPEPSLTPTLDGDTAHDPLHVIGLSPINTPLHYIIGYARAEHWFRFHTPDPNSTVKVHLDNLPVNYDLYVYSVSNGGFDGQSSNPGVTPELVTINNAPADDYMVRIVSVNGAFDPKKPYQLEFDVLPMSQK